jgi:hypothetical protein
MRRIANEPIKGFFLPEFPRSAEQDVAFVRGEGFPRVCNLAHFPTGHWGEKDMHMIGHHDPGMQVVAFAIKMQQRILHRFRDGILFQKTATVSLIEVGINAFAAFEVGFGFGPMREFQLPLLEYGLRHRVKQSKGHRLRNLAPIKMWKIPA